MTNLSGNFEQSRHLQYYARSDENAKHLTMSKMQDLYPESFPPSATHACAPPEPWVSHRSLLTKGHFKRGQNQVHKMAISKQLILTF